MKIKSPNGAFLVFAYPRHMRMPARATAIDRPHPEPGNDKTNHF